MEEIAEVSINYVVGLSAPKTMKIKGKIDQQEVITMIYCGATHNFISTKVVQKFGLSLEETLGYGVLMGTGLAVKGVGICRSVTFTLQNIEIVEDFLPLEMGICNFWYAMVGILVRNAHQLEDLIYAIPSRGGVAVLLQGDPTLSPSLVSLKAMWKAPRECGEGVLIELGYIELLDQLVDSPAAISLQRILDQFQSVFQTPLGLPPRHSWDYIITLQPGTPPTSVRPYRYPHIQKTEIERLVKDMLIAGIIQPSSSPFSSLVLLVKKKKRWRLTFLC